MITDVDGVRVGHWTDTQACTGCTVVLLPEGSVGSYVLVGGAPGTRETDLLEPHALATEVHAFLLTGGSAFGLAAADGVLAILEERGIGLSFGAFTIPLVPSAVIFDLGIGDPKVRPGPEQGRAAVEAAGREVPEGSVGAGTGATVGKWAGLDHAMKGGLGTASRRIKDAVVGALVVCNAAGDVLDERGETLAGCRATDVDPAWAPRQATVLACVVTDAKLTKARARSVAQMAAAGITRTVRPAHTLSDGDIVFCASTGRHGADPSLVGSVAAEVVADALRRGVRAAGSLGGIPAVSGA